MPLDIRTRAAQATVYPSPFVGPINHTVAIRVDVSTLTTAEVDAYGYIKPGVPLQENGALVSGAAQVIFGCVVEAVKIAADNAAATLAAAADKDVTVSTIGQVNQDVLEANLGRVLSANELAAIKAAGSLIKLV